MRIAGFGAATFFNLQLSPGHRQKYLTFAVGWTSVLGVLVLFHFYLRSELAGADVARRVYDAKVGPSAAKAPWSYAVDALFPGACLSTLCGVALHARTQPLRNLIEFAAAITLCLASLIVLGRLWLIWQPMPPWYTGSGVFGRGPDAGCTFICLAWGLMVWVSIEKERCSAQPRKRGPINEPQ